MSAIGSYTSGPRHGRRQSSVDWRAVALAALVAAVAGGADDCRAQDFARQPQASTRSKSQAAPKDDYTRRLEFMLRSMRIARDVHVNRPEKPVLVKGAIEGLLASLDPEAEIYTRAELRRLMAVRAGRASAGVGLELRREAPGRRRERPGYTVVTAVDGSTAAAAGLKAGDLVIGIDGVAAGPLAQLDMVGNRLPGPAGTQVRLRIERAGGDGEEDVTLTRGDAAERAVAGRELGGGLAYVRIGHLGSNSVVGLERELSRLVAMGGPIEAAVLDLRSASGGSLADADGVADAFLERGGLGRLKTREGTGARAEARPGDLLSGQPLVVLIDGGTAGALESLAAVLKESGRARLVGTRSAGRGASRELVPLGADGEKGALRLVTSQLLTPAGQLIEGKGIAPDVVVEPDAQGRSCRSLDRRDTTTGLCVARPADQDPQLQRALALVSESRAVADGAAGRPRRD